jgi:hypothetical protein
MAFWSGLKGVLTHSTPDWYVQSLAFTNGQCSGDPGGNACGVILWNASQPAVTFYIYKFVIWSPNIPNQIYCYPVGSKAGTVYNTGYPVVAQQGTPPGTVYTWKGAGTSDYQHVPMTIELDQNSTEIDDANFPLIGIPPNSGFNWDSFSNSGFGINIWYLWR